MTRAYHIYGQSAARRFARTHAQERRAEAREKETALLTRVSRTGKPEARAEAAAKPADLLCESEALSGGVWFDAQAAKATAGVDTIALRHAEAMLARYLHLHGQQDATGKLIAERLDDVRKRLRASLPDKARELIELPHEVIHTWGDRGLKQDIHVNGVAIPGSFQAEPSRGKRSHAVFHLEEGYAMLQSAVACRDRTDGVAASDVTFIVVGDGKELWRSKPMRKQGTVQVVRVNRGGPAGPVRRVCAHPWLLVGEVIQQEAKAKGPVAQCLASAERATDGVKTL